MRPLLAPLIAGLMAMLPLSVSAEPFGYAVGFSTLYRINLATGQATAVGNGIGFNDVEGLAIAPDGTLFGVADATAGLGSSLSDLLIRIDTTTGTGTLVAAMTGLSGLGAPPTGNLDYGLAFTCDQRLWLSSDTTNQLWEVNPGTGAPRFVGNTGAPISGLAARGSDLFGVSQGATPSLFRVDTATGAGTLIGALSVGGVVDDAGLDFDAAGNLWSVLDPEPVVFSASRIARIDPETGQGTVVSTSTVSQIGMEGLAIAPVPACGNGGGGNSTAEPLTVPGPGLPMLALFGVFAAAFGVRQLRRKGVEA